MIPGLTRGPHDPRLGLNRSWQQTPHLQPWGGREGPGQQGWQSVQASGTHSTPLTQLRLTSPWSPHSRIWKTNPKVFMAPCPPGCGVSPELWSCPLPSDIVPPCPLDSKGPRHWGMDFSSWTRRGSSLPPEMGPTWRHQLQSLLEKRNFIVHKGYVAHMALEALLPRFSQKNYTCPKYYRRASATWFFNFCTSSVNRTSPLTPTTDFYSFWLNSVAHKLLFLQSD